MMKKRCKSLFKNRKALVAMICYGLFALVWLGMALAAFLIDSAWAPRELDPAAAALENLTRLEDGSFHSENVDPQLIFEGIDGEVRTVLLEAEFRYDPGELELFYTRKDGQGFSTRMRVIGAPQDGGGVLFTLPPGAVRALRLDPGTAGDNTIAITAVTVNPDMPAGYYFVPTLGEVLAFALVPALALCVIYSIIEMINGIRDFMTKRRKKNGAAGSEA